jgi:hypothetical protein
MRGPFFCFYNLGLSAFLLDFRLEQVSKARNLLWFLRQNSGLRAWLKPLFWFFFEITVPVLVAETTIWFFFEIMVPVLVARTTILVFP